MIGFWPHYCKDVDNNSFGIAARLIGPLSVYCTYDESTTWDDTFSTIYICACLSNMLLCVDGVLRDEHMGGLSVEIVM